MNGASTSETGGPVSILKKESRRPKYTKFTQQELPACKPLLTPGWVIAIFLTVGVIFVPIGVVTLLASNSVVQIVQRYDDTCLPAGLTTRDAQVRYIQNPSTAKDFTVILNVVKYMKSPVYVYYELDNFYQNHRRYVKSRNDQQLRGQNVTDLSSCKPEDRVNGLPITPCGLIAWSLFNDTYAFSIAAQTLPVNKTGIAWRSDVDKKFGSSVFPQNFPNNNGSAGAGLIGGAALLTNVSLDMDEDLIVWMRTAALPTFRKLWGRIEQEFQPGTNISVTVRNQYNTYSFGGKKKLILSTTSWLGGKNMFLGTAYLTMGLICIFLAFVFFLIYLRNPRPLGDPSYLSWNRKNNTGEYLRT